MALIKQSNARDIARDAIVLDLGDLQRQASAIVAEARAQAAAMSVQARAERDRIVSGAAEAGRAKGEETGRAEGYKIGLAEGRAAAISEYKERLGKIEAGWAAALAGFSSDRDEMFVSCQRDVLRLAVGIAERVTKRTIQGDPTVAIAQLEAVLGMIVRPTELVVRIHPEDRALIADALPRLASEFSLARHIELVDDPTIDPGSCVAGMRGHGAGATGSGSFSPGEIDASVRTQLDRIVEALLPGEAIIPPTEEPPNP